MRILLTSVGRRGYLVNYFKDIVSGRDKVYTGDCSAYTSALLHNDHSFILPRVDEDHYTDHLLELCQRHKISVIVPLIDSELKVLSDRRDDFLAAGIVPVVSPLHTISICFDKYLTFQFGRENNIAVPQTVVTLVDAFRLLSEGQLHWPLVVKPRQGSASIGITICHDQEHLKVAFDNCPMPMIQQFLEGQEYGYDLFGDHNYCPISVFCKKKLSMRAGETDKAVSVNTPELISLGQKIAESLQVFGPIDVDVIVDGDGPKLLEINPRFGGGYPCSHLCGADFPAKLMACARQESLTPDIGNYPANIYMFKQDEIITCDQTAINSLLNAD